MEVLTLRDWSYTARALIWWRRFATIWNCNVPKGSCSDAWPRGGGIVLGVLCSLQKEGPLYWAARNRSWKVMSRPQALMRPLHLGLPWCGESQPGSTTANSAVTFPSLWRTERFGNNEPKSFFKLLLSSSWSEQSKGNEYRDLKKQGTSQTASVSTFQSFLAHWSHPCAAFHNPTFTKRRKYLGTRFHLRTPLIRNNTRSVLGQKKRPQGAPEGVLGHLGVIGREELWSRHLHLPNACGRYWSLYRAAWETVRRGRNEVSLG